MPTYIVDASVGIKLFVTEELADEAIALVSQVSHIPPTKFAVPDLFYVECANILWKYVCRFEYSETRAIKDIELLSELALQSYPTKSLVPAALVIAPEYKISAYDACYVALAEQIGAPLVTADKRLISRLANTDCEVLWLGDLDLGMAADE